MGLGRPVSYYPALARIVGVKECVFVCQFLYWFDKTADGWVYKTQEEITAETGMSRTEQETVRKNLKRTGVLEERHARLLHRMFYRISLDRLAEVWDKDTSAGNLHSGELELGSGVGGNPAPAAPVNPHSSLRAETTSETTSPEGKPRARNLLFDALCQIEGSNPDEIGAKGSQIAAALRLIRQFTADVTPEEITRRAVNYRVTWPGITLTANALAKHWAKFGTTHAPASHQRTNGRHFEQAGSYDGITNK